MDPYKLQAVYRFGFVVFLMRLLQGGSIQPGESNCTPAVSRRGPLWICALQPDEGHVHKSTAGPAPFWRALEPRKTNADSCEPPSGTPRLQLR